MRALRCVCAAFFSGRDVQRRVAARWCSPPCVLCAAKEERAREREVRIGDRERSPGGLFIGVAGARAAI